MTEEEYFRLHGGEEADVLSQLSTGKNSMVYGNAFSSKNSGQPVFVVDCDLRVESGVFRKNIMQASQRNLLNLLKPFFSKEPFFSTKKTF